MYELDIDLVASTSTQLEPLIFNVLVDGYYPTETLESNSWSGYEM